MSNTTKEPDPYDKLKTLGMENATVAELVDRMLQPHYAAAERWQPISTAPKDGTRIVLWLPKPWVELRVAAWYEPWDCWVEETPDEDCDERYGIGSALPTHWMAPGAPQAAKEVGDG